LEFIAYFGDAFFIKRLLQPFIFPTLYVVLLFYLNVYYIYATPPKKESRKLDNEIRGCVITKRFVIYRNCITISEMPTF